MQEDSYEFKPSLGYIDLSQKENKKSVSFIGILVYKVSPSIPPPQHTQPCAQSYLLNEAQLVKYESRQEVA